MNKFSFLLITVYFLTVSYAKAQKDTLVAYMKSSREISDIPVMTYIVDERDSADFIRMVIKPDKSFDKKLFQIRDFYLNGKQKLSGYSTGGNFDPSFQGTCMEYFPSGKRKGFYSYEKGVRVGEMARYFPNGKIYVMGSYNTDGKATITMCNDSIGNALVENGNGSYIVYADDFKAVAEHGAVKNGMKDGKWQGALNDTLNYEAIYDNGKFISGFNIGKNGAKTELTSDYTRPTLNFKTADGHSRNLGYHVGRNARYPALALARGITGKVQIEMYVTRNGQLMDIHAVTGDSILAEELLRVMIQSPPWQPAKYFGQPVDIKYSFSANFTLSGNVASIDIQN